MNKLLQNILAILTPQEKRHFFWLTILNIIISILDIASLALLVVVLNFYTKQQPYVNTILSGSPIGQKSPWPIVVFFLFFLIKNIGAYLLMRFQYQFVFDAAGRLSQNNLSHHLQGSYGDHIHTDSAVLIRKIIHQPIEFAQYVLTGMQQIITETTLVSIALAAILVYNPKVFMIVTALLLPVACLAWFNTRKRIKSARDTIKQSSELALQNLKEALNGYVESNIYGKKDFFTKRYAQGQQKLNSQLASLQIIQAAPPRLMEVFAVLGLLLLVTVNLYVNKNNQADIITIGAFMAAAYKIIPGLVRIINTNGQINAYRFTVGDLLTVNASHHLTNNTYGSGCKPIKSYHFKNVCFSYQGHQVLHNFNAHIKSGEFVGISSPSGKGKTTFINLLLGFLQETGGGIYINEAFANINIRRNHQARVAYVKQQTFIINDTIEKNILLDEVVVDIVKLHTVVEAAGLTALISQHQNGIKAAIEENGKNISGGQRQRIAIARALYKDADVIILDEPFNELDYASEALLVQHFKMLAQTGKMVILVTHRQESLIFCDKILSVNG